MKKAILFDLGNTLAYYFEKSEFPEILKKSVTEVQSHLRQRALLSVSEEVMWGRVKEENHESSDYQVRPLEGRLTRIFKIRDKTQSSELIGSMCRWFMKPIFVRVRIYQDTIAALKELKSRGYKLAIVSNTTWGSPASLWRETPRKHRFERVF
ncbi:MAG: HAD hydrolase-like protein [Candidatus Bathyarchaeota archaeon]|nr:HAD hydrolase-like protein [Candidatus Bathyarchaeota archaeon]MDH5787917.1 HAD hydrolase-like protein [Candidatus Bathyarchaeota archaeon]